MSHTKAGGSTKLGRDSQSQRLGVKLFGGQQATTGALIVRQRGTKMIAGEGTFVSTDHTIHAARPGTVGYAKRQITKFTGSKVTRTLVIVK
jgi:large subunit ribosomal protein L27